MTPDEPARRHPRLHHLTMPESVDGILRHGLLSAMSLLDRHEADAATRSRVPSRRAAEATLDHAVHGRAVIDDNRPLSDARLARVLDDGLCPEDWRRMLAERVFFWADDRGLSLLAGARMNRSRPRAVPVIDAGPLARAHGERMEIPPINSGATIHQPPRRGPSTYAPLPSTDCAAWRRRRGRASPDTIREVTVRGGVPDIAAHLLDARLTGVA